MKLKSILRPFYAWLRPIYAPVVARSIFVTAGEKVIRFGLSRNMKKGPFIILACMPKSGSTFIVQLLHKATGFPTRRVMTSGENSDIDATAVRTLAGLGTVTQIHFICTGKFVELANSYDIRTVVVERNLLDVVVSYAEYMCSEEVLRSYQRRGFISAGQNIIVDQTFCDLPMARKYDLIIDLALPWYLRFHVAWRRYEQSIRCRPLWVDYDEFFSDVPRQAERLLKFCGVDSSTIVAPSQSATKFNVGLSGRGKELLSRGQIARIENLAAYYPEYADELIRW